MRSSVGINAHWTTLYCSSLFFHSINNQGCYKDVIRINPWTQNGSFNPIPNTEHWKYTANFNRRKAVHDTEVNHLYICTLSWREYSINIPNRTKEVVTHTLTQTCHITVSNSKLFFTLYMPTPVIPHKSNVHAEKVQFTMRVPVLCGYDNIKEVLLVVLDILCFMLYTIYIEGISSKYWTPNTLTQTKYVHHGLIFSFYPMKTPNMKYVAIQTKPDMVRSLSCIPCVS